MRRILAVFFLLVPVLACADENFRHISLVTFRNNPSYMIGEDVQSVTSERRPEAFSVNRYETTYGLWYQARIQAEKIGYYFANAGQAGSSGKHGAAPDEDTVFLPVTMISWYDAVVWCNALRELKGRTPCYTYNGEILRDSGDTASCDLAVCDWDADGFRLLSEAEWEFAARRTKSGFQRGDLVSGQVNQDGFSDSQRNPGDFAWYSENAEGARNVGTAGTVFLPDAVTQPGTGNANGAGIFDMSGNVLEFCWDWFQEYQDQNDDGCYGPQVGFERVSRGGSWSTYTPFLFAADRYAFDPNESYNYLGFRICTSVQTAD